MHGENWQFLPQILEALEEYKSSQTGEIQIQKLKLQNLQATEYAVFVHSFIVKYI